MSVLDEILAASNAPAPAAVAPPAAAPGPDPLAPAPPQSNRLAEVLRLFVPALVAGMAARKNGLAGVGGFAGGYADSLVKSRALKQQEEARQQQLAQQQEELALRRQAFEETRARQAAADQQRMDAARQQAKDRMDSLIRDAISNAEKNPNFTDMVSETGADKYTITVDGQQVPLNEALDFIGVVKGGDGKYLFGKPVPPAADPYVTSREAGPDGTVTESLIKQSERIKKGPTVVSRPTPEKPGKATTKVKYDTAVDDDVVTFTDATGSSVDVPREKVRALLQAQNRASDDTTVDKVMRSAAAMQELLK